MKTTDRNEPIDWRARLHSLPIGTENEPASPVFAWLFRAILSLGLFLAGSLFVLVSGASVGLSVGIGPDLTGGALWVLLGLLLDLLAGAVISAIVARHSTSLRSSRLVFYSFTAPAFLAVLLMAASIVKHSFQ